MTWAIESKRYEFQNREIACDYDRNLFGVVHVKIHSLLRELIDQGFIYHR